MRPEGGIPVSAHDVARELQRRLPGVGVIEIHKFLYYCQGWHLAHIGRQLFSEHIEAWANGPVVATLWREARDDVPAPEPRELGPEALETVGYVVSRYGSLTAQQLIDLTHQEDPWRDVSRSESFDQLIPLESIRTFFDAESSAARRLADSALRDGKALRLISKAMARRHESEGEVDDPAVIAERLDALA